jgi:adenylosuccinate synthase
MHTARVIVDLTFGDAGKGSITDALVRRGANLVVRYNGGAQAAHTVIDQTGRCHIFHQFGSGTLVEGVETLLSRFMMVNPLALHYEELELRGLGITNAAERMRIDGHALVTTPYHMIANRLREIARGANRHGSCGLGIGETAADALDFESNVIRYGNLSIPGLLKRKLAWHRDLKLKQLDEVMPSLLATVGAEKEQVCALLDQLHSEDEMEATLEVFSHIAERFQVASPDFLAARMRKPGSTVFEGAQGVLLDENFGFHPHTTWSNTTPTNALHLIEEAQSGAQTTVLGLTRAYQTRHGTGPFPTEAESVTMALPEPHNPTNEWQGPFRAGWLDLSLLRYAIQASGRIDGLVVTCLDRLQELPEIKFGNGYRFQGTSWHLNIGIPNSLAAQEENGKMLRKVDVVYASAPSDAPAYSQAVADFLRLPLLGTSHGPLAHHKQFAF